MAADFLTPYVEMLGNEKLLPNPTVLGIFNI
jgi:hypothetical protein